MSATSQYTNTAARVETKWIQFKQFAYGWGWLSCYSFTAHQSASLALQTHLSTGQMKKGLQGLYCQQWHRALQEEQIHAVRQGFANRREGTRARDQKSLEAWWGLVFRWVFLSKCKKKVEIIKYVLDIKPADIKSWVHWGDSSGKKTFKLHRKISSCHCSHILVCTEQKTRVWIFEQKNKCESVQYSVNCMSSPHGWLSRTNITVSTKHVGILLRRIPERHVRGHNSVPWALCSP